MENRRADTGVSEIIGVVLLLLMAIALFSTVYLFVMNEALDVSEKTSPSVTVLGTIGGGDIILEHRGGEALSLDTKIMITISGMTYNMTVGDLLDDESKGDGKWSIGEKLSYGPSLDITGRQVRILVIDEESGSMVMQGVLQEGDTSMDPFVITRYATNVVSYSAKLWMEYDFKNYSGYLGFAWKPDGGDWTYSSPPLGSGDVYSVTGSYAETINGLIPGTLYWFKTQLKYGSTMIEGSMASFTTLGWDVGIWHFDENTGTIAYDSSGRGNDGTLKPNAVNRPQWTMGINGSALNFDGIDDYVEVSDDNTLDLTDAITIEAWMKPLENSEGFIGDINSVIDTSEFGILDVYEPTLIHILGKIYAIACRGTDNDGFLITMKIENNGQIREGYIDIFEFDTSSGYEPNIISINGDVYVIAYRGLDNDGFLKTVEIDSEGEITNSVIDTLEYDANYGGDPNIIHVDGTIYAIAHTGSGSDGYLTTLQIENNGIIANSVIDILEFDVADMGVSEEFNIIHVAGDVYAIAYRNPDSDGYLKTVEITSGGQIGIIDTFSFDVFDGYHPSLIHVAGEIYAIAYGGFDDSGVLKTVEIANNGQITDSIIDTLEFDTFGKDTTIIHVNGDVYAIVYRGYGNDGFLKTVEIANNGQITDSVVDTLEFDTSSGYEPKITHVDGDVYAICYQGSYSDGFIKTVEIAANGDITNTIIDTQEFGAFRCYYPNILHVNEDVYVVVYRGYDDDGFLKTVKIADDGTITNKVIDTLEFDKSSCYYPSIIHINGDVYAIAYTGSGSDGFLKTVRIGDNGKITNIVIDTLEFDTSYGYEPSIIHTNGDIYAIAYTGPGSDGFLKTVEIAGNGMITDGVIDTLEFDTSYARYSDIVHVYGGTIYAVAYMGPSSDGFLKTVEIASNGTITDGVIDTLEFDTSYCYEPKIIHISGGIYAIAYTGRSSDGFLKTLRIGNNGNIVNLVDDSLEYHTSDAFEPSIIHVDGTIFAIAYRDYHRTGFVKTVEIDLEGTIREILSKDGAYGISANATRVFATINTEIISAPISPGFNYIAFTYNSSSNQLKLYINGTEMANGIMAEVITTNTNNLYFGKVNAIIDEVKIYGMSLSESDIVSHYTAFAS